ncbi:MAG: DUF3375 domain-containing protein [Myxococcaceae bacterium]
MSADALDLANLQKLRDRHPAWRLLTAAHAPLIISFLHQAFLAANTRTASQQSLASLLDDHLHAARLQGKPDELPRSAEAYLDDWASDGAGWLRKFYPPGEDQAHFDLTPAAERAIAWVARLLERRFVGTESRLKTVFQLLADMIEGSEADPKARLAELEKRRAQIDAEMERIRAGHLEVLDPTALKDRFQQMAGTARELLSDFRELEQSFRELDREVRHRIATWTGSRGELLDDVLGQRDLIAASDQGTSFRAFWDFLMSPDRQEDFTAKLQKVFGFEAVRQLAPDPRLRRVHYDWLEAGEVTQRTVARLSEQLRRFLDDKVWLENRRIMEIIRTIEHHAMELRETPPTGSLVALDAPVPDLDLPLERPLFAPPFQAKLESQPLLEGDDHVPADALFEQISVDRARLRSNIRQSLLARDQVSLAEVLAQHPLRHGLAELVGYVAVASEEQSSVIGDETTQSVQWTDPRGRARSATVPLIVFTR